MSLTSEDIEQLFQLEISEKATLDYKKDFLLADESVDKGASRTDLLTDVVAMYNTEGGCIVYGISEKKSRPGLPGALENQEIDNPDLFDRKLVQIIRSHTDPIITTIAVKHLQVQGHHIVVLGIGKRYGLPSMVTYKSINKFFKRNLSMNYPVPTNELYSMFTQNQTLIEKAEAFKNSRIQRITEGRTLPPVDTKGAFFLHAVPLSFQSPEMIDIATIHNHDLSDSIEPIVEHTRAPIQLGQTQRLFNYDGFLASRTKSDSNEVITYNQFFRNGVVEFFSKQFYLSQTGGDYLFGNAIISATFHAIQKAILFWKYYGIQSPFLVFITLRIPNLYCNLTGIQNNIIGNFKKNIVDLPPALFDGMDYVNEDLYLQLVPHYNVLWQTAGAHRCPSKEEFFHRSNL